MDYDVYGIEEENQSIRNEMLHDVCEDFSLDKMQLIRETESYEVWKCVRCGKVRQIPRGCDPDCFCE